MSRIPRVTGSDLLAALSTAGFAVIRITGSHHFVPSRGWADHRRAVARRRDDRPRTAHKILSDCKLKVEDLQELL